MQIEPIFRSAPHGHSQKSKHPKSSHYRRGCSGKTGRSEKASRKKKVSPTVPTAVSALAPATVKPDAKAKPKANIAKPKTLPAANANAALSAERVTLKMLHADGRLREIVAAPLLRFQMKGTGYGHPDWKHGSWKGELATHGERWRPDDLDPLSPENLHLQQLVRCESDGKVGFGLVEQLCVGAHAPSGFRKINDGAV